MYMMRLACALAAASLPLACAQADPVADNMVAPPDDLLAGDETTPAAAPLDAAAAETAHQAAQPLARGGLSWSYRAQDRTALFGPPASPAFSIQCQAPREGEKQLIFIRHVPGPAGAKATLSFTGNGQAASVPVAAVADPVGPGGHWRAVISPEDSARDIAEAFAGTGAVEATIGGVPPLNLPADPAPRAALAECLR
jgi:hypothetical protein